MKRIRFNLELNGQSIHTVEDFQSSYGVDEIYLLYKDGTLARWFKQQGEEGASFLKIIDNMPTHLTEEQEEDYLLRNLFDVEKQAKNYEQYVESVAKEFTKVGSCDTFSDFMRFQGLISRLSSRYSKVAQGVTSPLTKEIVKNPLMLFFAYLDDELRSFFEEEDMKALEESISELIKGNHKIIVSYNEEVAGPQEIESMNVKVIPLKVISGSIQSVDGGQYTKSLYPALEIYNGLTVNPGTIFPKVTGSYMRLGDVKN